MDGILIKKIGIPYLSRLVTRAVLIAMDTFIAFFSLSLLFCYRIKQASSHSPTIEDMASARIRFQR